MIFFTLTSRRGEAIEVGGAEHLRQTGSQSVQGAPADPCGDEGFPFDIDRVFAVERDLCDERFVGDHAPVKEQTA